MRGKSLALALFVTSCSGCSYDDGKWSFDPFALFEKDEIKYKANGEIDFQNSGVKSLREKGYGYNWDDLKD